MDPDPGGPKTYESYGSGFRSATLLQVLEFLLDHHVSTELTDTDLWQPLHAAACWGHLEAGLEKTRVKKKKPSPVFFCFFYIYLPRRESF